MPSSCSRSSAIFLSNAVKYSPNGGTIEVEAATIADEAVIAIVDRGIGIRSSDLDRLFERYYRGGNVSGIVGTGVGLYLVKMAVDLHKGLIQVESEEGNGARFVVRMPLKRVEAGKSLPPMDIEPRMPLDAPSIVSSDNMT